MKKFASLLLALVMVLSMATAAFAAKSSTDTYGYAAYAATAPVIDGEIDEVWAAAQEFVTLNDFVEDIGQAYGTIKVMWDENNLYFLAIVNDPTVASSAADSSTNAVNFWVSETNYAEGGDFTQPGDYALISNQAGNIGYYTGNKAITEKAEVKAIIYADAEEPYYVVEARVPVLTEGYTFTEGGFIGLDISIDDDVDGDNARDAYCNWRGQTPYWSETAVLANVQLVKEVPAAE